MAMSPTKQVISPGNYERVGAIIGRALDGSPVRDAPDQLIVLTGKVRNLVYDFDAEPCVRVRSLGEPDFWVAVRVLTPLPSLHNEES